MAHQLKLNYIYYHEVHSKSLSHFKGIKVHRENNILTHLLHSSCTGKETSTGCQHQLHNLHSTRRNPTVCSTFPSPSKMADQAGSSFCPQPCPPAHANCHLGWTACLISTWSPPSVPSLRSALTSGQPIKVTTVIYVIDRGTQ